MPLYVAPIGIVFSPIQIWLRSNLDILFLATINALWQRIKSALGSRSAKSLMVMRELNNLSLS